MKHDLSAFEYLKNKRGRPRNSRIHRKAAHLIGLRIQALRLAKGWTQDRLAGEARMPTSTISAIEFGRSDNIRSSDLVKLRHALGCTYDFLLGE